MPNAAYIFPNPQYSDMYFGINIHTDTFHAFSFLEDDFFFFF